MTEERMDWGKKEWMDWEKYETLKPECSQVECEFYLFQLLLYQFHIFMNI